MLTDDDQGQSNSSFVLPGERLGHSDDYQCGKGTYYRFGYIHASIAGFKEVIPADVPTDLPSLVVTREQNSLVTIPKIGDIVTCRVSRIHPRFATVEIICVNNVPLRDRYNGMIRVQDVRATEIDKVEIYLSFRPNDIVRAEVVCFIIIIIIIIIIF